MVTKNGESLSQGIVNVFRGLTRPFVTAWFAISWVMYLFMIHQDGGTFADMPPVYTWVTLGTVVWWFGDRTWFKLKGK